MGIHVGVWQPHWWYHGGPAGPAGPAQPLCISLQPNCMMLGWHAHHQVQGILLPATWASEVGLWRKQAANALADVEQ